MRILAWSTKNFRFTREQNKHIRIADRIYSFYFKILLIQWISPTTYLKKQHSVCSAIRMCLFCSLVKRLLFRLTVSATSGIFLSFRIKPICRVSFMNFLGFVFLKVILSDVKFCVLQLLYKTFFHSFYSFLRKTCFL